jgi:hypothetical protein
MNGFFEFKQCATLNKAAGRKAENLRELRDVIESISRNSIFHHTHQYLLKGHILEYTNDFSQWVGESLGERALAEHLSNIDPYDYGDIEELRVELVKQLDQYLEQFPEPRDAMPGDEFFFRETVTLVFPAGVWVRNLAEFLMAIKYVDASSIYYHFYDARQRHSDAEDDFSTWFELALGKRELAKRIRVIDPFMHSLDGIREHITEAVEEEVKKDMESAGVAQ